MQQRRRAPASRLRAPTRRRTNQDPKSLDADEVFGSGGVWSLESGVWSLESGVWSLEQGRLRAGS